MAGYEKGITRKWLRMVLHNEYPPQIPGFPKDPHKPGRGTPNHQLLAHLARVTWAVKVNTEDEIIQREVDWTIAFFEDQKKNGFMTRGNANEQLSPSHSQWWITAVLGLRWLAYDHRDDEGKPMPGNFMILRLTGWWLKSHHALCRLFATPTNPPSIVAPGARAWPRKPDKPYYGKSTLRDQLYTLIETGTYPRKIWDPEKALDMAGMYFAKLLIDSGDKLGNAKEATDRDIPYLRWPIYYMRKKADFVGYLPSIEGADLEVQRLAGWVGGREIYGFDDDQLTDLVPDQLVGGSRRSVGDRRKEPRDV